MNPFTITRIELWPVDIPLTDPFVVATGRLAAAQNIFVRLTLTSGAHGYGEIAPFPEVGGNDRASCLELAPRLANAMLGRSAACYKQIAGLLGEMAPAHPAVHCGLETALLDALCRELMIPLWGLWGGADVRTRDTDITIPITGVEQTVALARNWYSRGFRLFKTKVGADVEEDIRRLEAMQGAFADIAIIADANQGFTREECMHFIKEVRRAGTDIVLLEQPVSRDALSDMAAVRRDAGIPVAADESVRSLQDVMDIVRHKAADFVNIKIMKSGVLHSMEIAALARASGLKLMIGGMVESRIAMGCSFAQVLGNGGFEVLDLDTPLLLAADPIQGGYRYAGPALLPWQGAGLDLELDVSDPLMIIE
jgi:o-succinylbenzoate synthase